MHPVTSSDRRVARTRARLISSFNRLILARGYGGFTVRELLDAADVGRSTFYEHFESKDDLFEQSISPLLAIFADAIVPGATPHELSHMIAHMAENAALSKALLHGAARRIMTRLVAAHVEDRLRALARSAALPVATIPLPLLASAIAQLQLGALEAWLTGSTPSTPQEMARFIHAAASSVSASAHRASERPASG